MEILLKYVENLLIGGEGIIGFIVTSILLPLWIALCFFIPHVIGKGVNRFILGGGYYSRLQTLFSWLAGLSFFAFTAFALGSSGLQLFDPPMAHWWYEKTLTIGLLGNATGIVCSGFKGIFAGEH